MFAFLRRNNRRLRVTEVSDTHDLVETLLQCLRTNGGVIRTDYSLHNKQALMVIGEAERRGLVTTKVIDLYDDQWSYLEVRLK